MTVRPLIRDNSGTIRFKANALVVHLLENGGLNMNDLSQVPNVSVGDREEFAQLIGYSVRGFEELSYVSDEAVEAAWKEPATEPVLFKDMTDAEQGALLMAKHRGEAIQRFGDMGDWLRCNPTFNPDSAYRVAPPKPKIEHVREKSWFRTQKVTVCFTTIDGVVDIASYRLEPRDD